MSPSPVAAITTGPSPAAIGVIEVSGPGALDVVAACFRAGRRDDAGEGRPGCRVGGPSGADFPPPSRTECAPTHADAAFPPGTLILGTLHENDRPLDEALLCRRPAAESWTGEDLVELHCHGGPVLLDAVLDALARRGVRRGTAADLAERAVRNGTIDRLQAEALACLAKARTPLAARVFLDQFNGVLSQFLRELLPLSPGQLAEKLDTLLSTAPFGLALSHPPRVVLAGAANAGKSTLFNALVGADRAIVHDAPGTTRDPVDDVIAPGGIPIRLVDTAGVGPFARSGVGGPSGADFSQPSRTECAPARVGGGSADDVHGPSPAERAPTRVGGPSGADPSAGADSLSAAAESATLRALAEADAVLWVVDATGPVPEAMKSLAASFPRPSAWVLNKTDLLQPETGNQKPKTENEKRETRNQKPETGPKPGTLPSFHVSALRGTGVPDLTSALPALAGVAPPDANRQPSTEPAPCLFTSRQRDAVMDARRALPDIALARQHIDSLVSAPSGRSAS